MFYVTNLEVIEPLKKVLDEISLSDCSQDINNQGYLIETKSKDVEDKKMFGDKWITEENIEKVHKMMRHFKDPLELHVDPIGVDPKTQEV